MPGRDFDFLLYRMNLVHEPPALPLGTRPIRGDMEIAEVIQGACSPLYEREDHQPKALYTWGLSDFAKLPDELTHQGEVILFNLVRSTVRQEGLNVLPDGTTEVGISDINPPLAKPIRIIAFMKRHIVAIEYVSELMNSDKWHDMLHLVIGTAASELGFYSKIEFEVRPSSVELREAFFFFDVLTKFKLTLRIANPDLPRFSEVLHQQMVDGGIRKFHQEMENPSGLNRDEGTLPFAAMALAEAGYKQGEVYLQGVKDGGIVEKVTGTRAAEGVVRGVRDVIRGIKEQAPSDEVAGLMHLVMVEINRITRE